MRYIFVFVAAMLAGCVNQPQSFAPNVQRRPALDGQVPKLPNPVVDMMDPDSESAIVKDIQRGGSGPWRWTGKNPEVRIFVVRTDGQNLKVRYAIAESTFRETGPVTLTFLVNGKPLGTVLEGAAGQKEFVNPIPPGMLVANTDNLFSIEIDKVFVSKLDGAQLGMILASVELTH